MNTKRTILPTDFGRKVNLCWRGYSTSIFLHLYWGHHCSYWNSLVHPTSPLQTGQPLNPTNIDFTTFLGLDPFKLCASYPNLTPDLTQQLQVHFEQLRYHSSSCFPPKSVFTAAVKGIQLQLEDPDNPVLTGSGDQWHAFNFLGRECDRKYSPPM